MTSIELAACIARSQATHTYRILLGLETGLVYLPLLQPDVPIENTALFTQSFTRLTTLRQAAQQDIDTLLLLMEQFYTYFNYKYDPPVHRRVVTDFLANPSWGSLWLIGHEGTTVGYLALTYGFTFEWKGRDAFVDELFVIEQYRSLGVGRKAVETIQQEAHRLGLVALHLQTEAYNGRAKRLYEALGFTDLQRSTLTWLINRE